MANEKKQSGLDALANSYRKALSNQKPQEYEASGRTARTPSAFSQNVTTAPRMNAMDMAINSLRNRVANSTIGRAANEWASRVSGNVQNVLNESPEVRAAKRQARAENEARRQQFAIDTANLIDQASAQYEGPTRVERFKTNLKLNDMDDAQEHEFERTVRNERYNPLSREERDALINRYADAVNGKTDANTYQQTLYDVTKNGGIEQLFREQQADAANDRDYSRILNGNDVSDMTRGERFLDSWKNFAAGTAEQIGTSGIGLYASNMNTAALNAANDESPASYRNALDKAVTNWYYGLVNGADDPGAEENIRRMAAYVGGDSYADNVIQKVRQRAEEDIQSGGEMGFSSSMLDEIESDDSALWRNLQGTIEESGVYDALDKMQTSSQKHIQRAKDINNLQDLVGGNVMDTVIEGGVSTAQNMFDAGLAATLGLSGAGAIAMIPFALRAYGGSYAEQINQARELGQMISQDVARNATRNATASAAIEVGTELMWGMVGAMSKVTGGGALDDAAQQKLAEAIAGLKMSESGIKTLQRIGEKALGGFTEGLEEVIGDAATRLLTNMGVMTGELTDYSEWVKEVGHSFVLGALGGLMGEITGLVSTPMQQSQIGKQLKAGGITLNDGTKITVDDMVNLANSPGMEDTTLAKTYESLFKGTPRATDSFSDRELGKLYEAYEETMGRSEEGAKRVQEILGKVENGEELKRSDVNRITNNPDAARYLRSASGTELNLDGNITERKAAVEEALRAFASQNETLRNAMTENLSPNAENANTGDLASQIENLPVINRQAMPNEIANGYFQDSTRDMVRNAAQRMGIGEEGQKIMSGLYSGNRENAIDYVGEMTRPYNLGRENKDLNLEDIPANGSVSAEEYQATWRAGRLDYLAETARKEINNDRAGQEVLVREGTERVDGQNPVGSSAAVGAVTGSPQVGQTGLQQRSAGTERVYSGTQVGARITESQLNARDMAAAGYNVVTDNNDAEANAVKNEVALKAKKYGINVRDVVLFRGAMANVNGSAERGFFIYHPDGTITIAAQLDNADATGRQIITHEFTHALIKNLTVKLGRDALGNLSESGESSFGTVRDYMAQELGGQDKLVEAVNGYAAVYKAAGVIAADENGKVSKADMQMVFEEMICDFVAGMNAFSEVGHATQAVRSTPVMAAAKKAVEKLANETRGSPTASEINSGVTARATIVSRKQAKAEGLSGIHKASPVLYHQFSEDELKNNAAKLRTMSVVSQLTGEEFSKGSGKLLDNVDLFFKKYNNNVYNNILGDVSLSRTSIRSDIRHGLTHEKAIAFAAAPDVIRDGVAVDFIDKGNRRERIIMAAPIMIGPDKYYEAVMLQRDPQSQRLYAHDVVTEKESNMDLPEHLNTTGLTNASDGLYITDILLKALHVKQNFEETIQKPIEQAISSADTSLNQVPALHKDSRVEWGKTNIDIGAGAYEAATEYLKEKGVTNLKWDPYNQSEDVNRATLKYLQDGNKADTATNANVLNVIAEKDARLNVVLQAAKSIKPDGKAYFMVYEGDGSGIGRRTSKGWQNNLKTKEYADEIRTYFNDVQVKGKLIVASNPKANLPMASWEVTPGNAVKFSTSLSSAYMAAAKRGDTETAQRLVDEAAEEAMPNSEIRNKNGKLLKVYHGTDADFNVFDTTVSGGKNGRAEGFGIYLSPDQEVTKSYGDRQIGMFANITKPAYSNRKTISVTKLKALLKSTCEAEAKEMAEDYGGSVKDALKDTWISNYVDTYSNSMEIAYTKAAQDILRMNGSDMEVIQEVMAGMAIREYADAIAFYNDHLTPVTGFDGFWTEWTNRETGKKTPVILAFNSNQLKVADAITRNDDGNIIPLEERFNPKNDDIRFSRDLTNRSSSELYEANRQLQKDLTELRSKLKTRTEQYKYWKGQTKTTEGRQLRIEDVTKLAREIIKGQESSADAKAVAEKMKALGEYLLNSQEENVYDEARLKAYEIAHDILANAKTLNSKGGDDFYGDFRTALKNQPIYVAPSVREEVAPDGWNDFRKAQYGTVNMTADQSKGKSVDKVYHDLQATFGEWLLPEYITSEADQLNRILEVIETYRPVYENLNSYEMADAVEWTANEILTRIIGEEIRETNPTYADRMEKKLADQKAKAQTALKQVRQQRDRKVQNLKEHYQQVAEDRRNRKIDSEMRTRLLKWARRVNNMKLPRVAGNLRDLMIGDLDTVAKSITGQKLGYLQALEDWYLAEQQNDPNFFQDKEIEAQLKRLHSKHINDLTQEEVADLITILQNFEAEWRHKDTGEMIDSAIKVDRYAAAMNTIDDVANTRGRRRGKGGKADRIAQTVDAFFVDNQLSPTRAMKRITGYHDGDPLSVLTKEVSDGYTKKIAFMMEANRKFDRWLNNKKFCRALMGKHARTITVRGAVGMTVREFHITPAMGIGLYLASMNDDNMRHIAQGGIQIADLERYRKGDLKGAFDTGEIAKFTREAAKAVENQLTDEEKAFAKAVYEYYNIMAPNAINDVSEVVSGYAKARVKNYYPIRVLQTYLDKNAGEVREGGTPGNAGFLNERTTSTKPIVLMDVVDVLRRSIDENSTYVGLEIPIRNFNLLKNTRVSLDDGSLASVQDMIQRKWGDEADKYISKMISDVQGKGKGQSTIFNNLVNVARGNQAKAALHLNAGTGIKQAASLPTAAAVLGTKPIVRSITTLARKVDPALIRKYTPLYDYRALGYSTPEIGDIREKKAELPKALKWIEAIDLWTVRRIWRASEYYVLENNKNLKPYSEEFYKEVKDIWEQTVQETQPNYTPMQRSQSLRSDGVERVVHLFKTQPYQNFNILYDAFAEAHAKRVQMVANTNDETKANYKKAKTGLARAVGSQIVSSFVFALMQYVVDLARGKKKKYQDDDGEDDILAWMKAMGLNMLSNGFGVLPLGSLILEGIENASDMALKAMGKEAFFGQKYYGLSDPTIDAINDAGSYLGSLINKIGNYANGNNSSETFIRNMVDAVSELSALAGIPVGNGLRTLQSITRIVLAGGTKAGLLYDGNMLLAEYNTLRLTTDPAKYKSDYYALLQKAWRHDEAAYAEIYNKMIEEKGFATESKSAKANVDASIKKWGYALLEDTWNNKPDEFDAMREKMVNLPGDPFASDTKTGEENIDAKIKEWKKEDAKRDEAYQNALNSIVSSDTWEQMSEKQQKTTMDNLLKIASGTDEDLVAKASEAKSVGLDETEYMLYRMALTMADTDNSGGVSGQELLAVINEGNYTDEQKAFLWKTSAGLDKEKTDKIIREGQSVGLDETEYMLYRMALLMYDEDHNGSYKQAEAEAAIRSMRNLTQAEKAYLFSVQFPKAKTNPFK